MKLSLFAVSAFLLAAMLCGPACAETAAPKAPSQSAASNEQQKPSKADTPRLSDDKFKIYKDAMTKARYDSKPINEQIKAKRKELAALMSAEKFDKAAYIAKDAEIHELMGKTARLRTEAMASVAEKFSVADRKILAEKFGKRKNGHNKSNKEKKRAEKIAP